MKRILRFVIAGITAGAFVVAGQATATASPWSGALHVTKECSHYTGAAGSYCTITSSNIPAIKAGWTVVYASALDATAGTLNSDVVIGNRDGLGNKLLGHVSLNFNTGAMSLTFTGGTGEFGRFTGSAVVSVDQNQLWHWDGDYSFGSGLTR